MTDFEDLKETAMNMALTEEDSLAGMYVNQVYTDLVVQSQALCTSATKSLVQGQQSYSITSNWAFTDLGQIQHLLYKAAGQTQGYVLEPASLEEVLQLSATNPTGYVRKYALQGLDRVWVWPAPQSSGDVMIVYYAQNPTPLALPGDVPTAIPSQWHHMIALGAAARLVDGVGEDLNLAAGLQAKYDVMFNAFVAWTLKRRGRGTQKMGHGYVRGVGFPTHDRSAYYSTESL